MSQVIIEKDRMGVERRYVEKFANFFMNVDGSCNAYFWDTIPEHLLNDPRCRKVRLEIPRELWDVPVIEAEVIKP